MAQHQAWKNASEETSEEACNGLEKYVMSKLAPIAFNTKIDIDSEDDLEEDKRLYERIQLLDFITPDHLEIDEEIRDERVWKLAGDETGLEDPSAQKRPGRLDSVL